MLFFDNIKSVYKVLLCAVFLISCKNNKEEKIQESNKNHYDFSVVKNKIQGWVDKGYYSGASILVSKNDTIVYKDYFGDYTKETQTFIASAGKWLAAATVASVVENTELSWDDKVKKWLPEFTDIKGEATLKQLFSHTSGFPDYQPEGQPKDHYQNLEESVKHIVHLPAKSNPGEAFFYGGLAMQVAGRMAELATNKNFEDLFQERIAIPLEMKNTHFTPVDDGGGHAPMLGGGAKSTLHDYARFLEMISHNGVYKRKQVLKKSSIEDMQANQVGDINNPVLEPDYVNRVRGLKHNAVYGLGEWREELDADGNAVLISSPSWAGTYPWIDKTTNTYGFFLTHVNVEKANKDGFSSFYSSPGLVIDIRKVLQFNHR
ncbi:serine hydrolase domain-containing protein [Mariniflexile jejuense]|uniref:Serine hydrolase domain-containing protein n=1 Tax=Mariniflexile jejuense TaxID=1173582 RepID=A0ABW3JKS2_9FLAO